MNIFSIIHFLFKGSSRHSNIKWNKEQPPNLKLSIYLTRYYLIKITLNPGQLIYVKEGEEISKYSKLKCSLKQVSTLENPPGII